MPPFSKSCLILGLVINDVYTWNPSEGVYVVVVVGDRVGDLLDKIGLIKIVGRQYVALGLVADKAFVKVAKGSES